MKRIKQFSNKKLISQWQLTFNIFFLLTITCLSNKRVKITLCCPYAPFAQGYVMPYGRPVKAFTFLNLQNGFYDCTFESTLECIGP